MDKKPIISIVAAISRIDRGLGEGDKLLWHLPDDLKRFKRLTLGHPVILGRKTFESIVGYLGGPLPGRINIVVTRNPDYKAQGPNVIVSDSIEEALKKARELDSEEIFIGGGANVYTQALPLVDRLYLTLIEDQKKADSFFPPYNEFSKKTFEEKRVAPDGTVYHWVNLERN